MALSPGIDRSGVDITQKKEGVNRHLQAHKILIGIPITITGTVTALQVTMGTLPLPIGMVDRQTRGDAMKIGVGGATIISIGVVIGREIQVPVVQRTTDLQGLGPED